MFWILFGERCTQIRENTQTEKNMKRQNVRLQLGLQLWQAHLVDPLKKTVLPKHHPEIHAQDCDY